MAQEAAGKPVVADGNVVREALPLPVVYYPALFGTFLAFAPDGRSRPALCACARPAVEHLLRLRPDLLRLGVTPDGLEAYFPAAVARRMTPSGGASLVRYVSGVCHQCNGATPSLRYCEDGLASSLMPTFGWYVHQTHLRLGILPRRYTWLEEVCPPGYREQVQATQRLERDLYEQCTRLLDGQFARAGEHSQELERMLELRQRASTARRNLRAKIEAVVMQELGGDRSYAHA